MHELYPQYDFAQHKGYITPDHAAALTRHGPCPEHRMSYANVAAVVAGASGGGNALVPSLVRDNVGVEDTG
jgi:ribonuclease HII